MLINDLIKILENKDVHLIQVTDIEDLYKVPNSYLIEGNEKIVGIHLKNLELSNISESILGISSLLFLRLVNVNFNNLTSISFLCKNLEVLSISKNNLTIFPKEILELESLKELSISHNKFKNFPKEILELKNLNRLSLAGNKIDKLPKEIFILKNLQNLNLSENLFKVFPKEILELEGLNSLSLSANQIDKIPKEISKLKNLQTLGLSENGFIKFPEEISMLKNLNNLSLSKNKLTEFPKEIAGLVNLHNLNLSNNRLNKFSAIEKLENLQDLILSKNELKEFPKEITKLKKLQYLSFLKNQLSTLPKEIGELKNLINLNLSGNQLYVLPKEIGELINLSSLNLPYNQLSTLPKEIGNLRNLRNLSLASNKVNVLPKEIGELKNLINLNLSRNRINKLVKEIDELKNLRTLNLSSNQLSEFPQEILKLKKLVDLRFKNSLEYDISNKIKIIPDEFINLTLLKKFEIDTKYLETTFMTAYISGLSSLKNTIQQKMQQGVEKLYEAKLLFVGEPGAGKTSLMEKILDKNYILTTNETTHSTLGIDIKKYEFQYVKDTAITFRTNMWDFGGQQVQYMSHQFFLTPNSLYILVGDDRKQHTDFDYWFHIINLLSNDSPVLVVLNELKHKSITNFDLKAFKERFNTHRIEKEDIDLSNMSDGRYEELKLKIENMLCNLPHIGEELPAKWIDIRNELNEISQNDYYISFDKFEELSKKHGLSNEDINTLSKHFHNLGIFLHYADDIHGLADIIFLNSKWIMDAIYSVLANTDVSKNNGKFTKDWLFKFWGMHENQYPLSIKNKLLTLMLKDKFEICYRIDEKEETYISPQLLPSVLNYDYNWDYTNNLFYRFQYPFMPKGIVSRLIVRLNHLIHKENKVELVWQKGVILKHGNTKAQVIEKKTKEGLKVIDISIVGEQIESQNLLSKIKFEVENIHKSSFQNINYDEMIPCCCGECIHSDAPEYYKFNTLKNFVIKNSFDVKCNRSAETILIDNLLGNVVIESDNSKEAELFKMIKEMGGIHMNNINQNTSNSSTNINGSFNQTQSTEITISQTINGVIDNLSSLKRKVEDEDKNKEEIIDLIQQFKELGNSPTKEDIKDSGLMTDLKELITSFDETIQYTGDVVSKTTKAITTAKSLGRTYNELASLCGLPTVPFFLVKE